MSEPRWTLDEAVAAYEQLAAHDGRTSGFLVDVARRLAASEAGSSFLAQASEECLTLCEVGQLTVAEAWVAGPWIDVRSELDEIEHCLEELGEYPEDLDPACWRVELRGRVRDEETGHEVDRPIQVRRCTGDAEAVARTVLELVG